MQADPPAGGGGGAAANGVAPHVAAGLAAAGPGEQAPAPLAAAAVGEHDLAAMEVQEEHDADQGALAAEEHNPAAEDEEGGQLDGDEHDDAEVAEEGEQGPLHGVLPDAGAAHPQPQQLGPLALAPQQNQPLGGGDGDNGDEVDLFEQEEQQEEEEEEIAALAGQFPLVPAAIQGGLPEAQPQPQELGPLNQQHALAPDAIVEQPLVEEHGLAPAQGQLGDDDDDDEVNQNQGQLGDDDDDEGEVNQNQGQPLVPPAQVDYLCFILAGVTLLVLGTVLLAELGTDITTWMSTLQTMTPKRWTLGVFVAMGDISSLVLIYAPAWKFRGIWRREEGAGVGAGCATMLPLVAAFINAGVSVFFGAVVAGKNWSVIIINVVGMMFQVLYVIAFCGRSEAPWRHKLLVLMLGAGAGVVIAIVDFFLLHLALGLEMDSAIGWSGAATSSCTYVFACLVNMSAAARSRGAHGVPAQAWASLVNATIWSVCGTLAQERRLLLLVPHIGGIGCFIAQAGQLLYFRRRRPQPEESEEELHRRLLPPDAQV